LASILAEGTGREAGWNTSKVLVRMLAEIDGSSANDTNEMSPQHFFLIGILDGHF
jgi:hypothetical protein